MLDAVVGAVIIVVATTSLAFSIELAEKAFDQAGRYPLSNDERSVLDPAGLLGKQADQFWLDNVLILPREVGNDD